MTIKKIEKFELISQYNEDPFVGHLSTPISTSAITKTYLSLLPAYKTGLSPLLRGINIGFIHGYFLLGPFVKLGPLRDSQVANFIGFLATISLIIILTACLAIYGYVTFTPKETAAKNLRNHPDEKLDILTKQGWRDFTSGFIVGGFGGTGIAYALIRFIHFDLSIF
jgi:photosystem I subunit 11